MQILTSHETRDIIRDRLGIKSDNFSCTTAARMGIDTYKLFPSLIRECLNGIDLFLLVPNESKSQLKGEPWLHDMSSFKILKLTKDRLHDLGIVSGNTEAEKITVRLDNSYAVYTSDEGVNSEVDTKTKKEFTLREQACLMLRIPESGTTWLDELIAKRNRIDNR
jgi:hypothetical protein